GQHGRDLMTALGPVRLERSYAHCPACEQGLFPADRLSGLGGWLTARALQMAYRAGVADPFRKAEALLEELAGWSVDADPVRRGGPGGAAAARAGGARRGRGGGGGGGVRPAGGGRGAAPGRAARGGAERAGRRRRVDLEPGRRPLPRRRAGAGRLARGREAG